eukprot:12668824-Alexandrium_andersonii.AAC.1
MGARGRRPPGPGGVLVGRVLAPHVKVFSALAPCTFENHCYRCIAASARCICGSSQYGEKGALAQ